MGEFDIEGSQIPLQDAKGNPIPKVDSSTGEIERNEKGEIRHQGQGEKITVNDSKTLVSLVENRRIERWLEHPIYGAGYLVPDPLELEEVHGMTDFRKRFNPLRFYTPEQLIAFAERDIHERTAYLEHLFNGQQGADELKPVIDVWRRCRIPSPQELEEFYVKHYG
jgi:hypothetical protein